MAEDIGIQRHSYWLDIFSEGESIYFPESETQWLLGPILTERVIHGDKIGSLEVSEASGVCITTQTRGPSEGMKAILKIRMQIPPEYESPEECGNRDYSEFKSTTISPSTGHEIDILEELTECGCSCTPKLLDYCVVTQKDNEYIPGGYIAFILMEKLPGRNLTNFHTFPLEKRDEVRIAFGKALREFHALGYWHMDASRRNVLWDEESKRCFIIDMEAVIYKGPRKFIPRRDYGRWCLIRKSPIYIAGELEDPMIPPNYEECPDDEALHALAARTREYPNVLK